MEERRFTIYTGKSRRTSLWRREELPWREFRDRLVSFRVTGEQQAEYLAMDREKQTEIKDVGGFVGGVLENGIRKKQNLKSRSVVTLDYDSFTAAQFAELREVFGGVSWAVYSTHKHTREAWRVRIVLPLARDVTPDEYEAVARKAAEMIGLAGIDRSTFEPSRLMFWPSRSTDADWIGETHDARDDAGADSFLDPDRILSIYDDWRDLASWPRVEGEACLFDTPTRPQTPKNAPQTENGTPTLVISPRGIMEDPTAKKGVVGAFCRRYSMTAALAAFLPDVYTPYRNGRYTYAGASTVGGLVVYDDKWAFSNHATDPAGGRELNAFDLVRVHKFGHLDAGSRARDVTGLPSYAAMSDFAVGLPEVAGELARENMEKARAAFDGVELPAVERDEEERWGAVEAKLLDRKGKFKATRENIAKVLREHPLFAGKIKYNEFTGRMEITEAMPWRRCWSPWLNDSDEACFRAWFETAYEVNAKEKISDALERIKGDVAYHPVRDYLGSLEWDGEARLEGLLHHVLGAADTALNRKLSALTWIGAVARVYKPGVKFDYCVTLFGPEGCGKSSLVKIMGGEWFTDSPVQIGSKDGQSLLRGKMVVELGEMASLRRADLESVKGFITAESDEYRPAYGRNTISVPRQCVFVATTNDRYCLRGYGDNRRFPVVECVPERREEAPWDYVPKWRDQLWAEAVHKWKAGEALFLDNELDAQARAEGRAHNFDMNNPVFETIDAYLDLPIPDNWKWMNRQERRRYVHGERVEGASNDTAPRRQVCVAELLTECLDLRPGTKDYTTMAREVSAYMNRRHAGTWERIDRVATDQYFGRPRGWKRAIFPAPVDDDLI